MGVMRNMATAPTPIHAGIGMSHSILISYISSQLQFRLAGYLL